MDDHEVGKTLIASGRDADVYALGDGRVLRRYRDGRSAEEEAGLMRFLADAGYPVPRVHEVLGRDMVMDLIEGPTMARSLVGGLDPREAGVMLATLHRQLHELTWPGTSPAEPPLHLDLHPLNVLMSTAGPVVIDWCNAKPGHPALDVSLTALILAQLVVTDGMLLTVGLPDDDVVMARLRTTLREFKRSIGRQYSDLMPEAVALRMKDSNLSCEERAMLPSAAKLALGMD